MKKDILDLFNLNDSLLESTGGTGSTKDDNVTDTSQAEKLPHHNPTTPGGIPEKLSAGHDEGYVNIPTPGGDTTTTTPGHTDGYITVPTPATNTIPVGVYNTALARLHKSFTEGAEVLQTLMNVKIEHVSIEEMQERTIQDAIDQAVLEAYDNGPFYEAVTREDKEELKGIVTKLRKDIEDYLDKDGLTFYTMSRIASAIMTGFKTYSWQVLGVVNIENYNIEEYKGGKLVDLLNKEFAEQLGDYKIIKVALPPSITDILDNKFNRNMKTPYMLIVDKKLTGEFKKMMTDVAKDVAVKEGVEFSMFDEDDDMIIESVIDNGAKITLEELEKNKK